METKKQSHCWWFDSHNTPRCSPWLQSTLSELNDKTKTMLKLVEQDADSFAQRAEMYYKKRPELISMVEDFYRTHRSLAERYDQLKSDRAVRVKSPLRHSISLPKEEYECVFDSVSSVKSFDSFTEAAYSSQDANESEVDDPEQDEDDAQTNVVEGETGKPLVGASFDELMKLRDELDRLREENEIQKNIIKQKDEEKEDLVQRFLDSIRELREETAAVRNDNLGVEMKQTGEVLVPFGEVTNFDCENMHAKKQEKKKGDEVTEVMKKFEAERTKNRYLEHALALKEEENVKVTRRFEETKSELAKLSEEMRIENQKRKIVLVKEDEEKQGAIRPLTNALAEKEDTMRQLKDALTERESAIRQLKDDLAGKDCEKQEAIRHLKNTLAGKDMETKDSIRQLKHALREKDEEKREAIRQLSAAMEMIREESKLLKKSLVNKTPKKSSAEFQYFKGFNLGKLFNPLY